MTKRLQWLTMLGLAGFLLTAGCSGDGTKLGPNGTPDEEVNDNGGPEEGNENEGVTLAQLSADIFTPSCAISGCHGGASRAGGISLNANVIGDEIVNVPSNGNPLLNLIEPNDPENSYLLRKLEGRDIVGQQMPLGGGRLPDEQIAAVRAWIEAGAPK